VKVPSLDLAAQMKVVGGDVRAAIERVLGTQAFILGEEGAAFEREIAAHEGALHAVGVSSGTDALIAGLTALGIGAGDEVVTSPFTFVATGSAIARVGARMVLADIDAATFALDTDKAAQAFTHRTRAVIPVHLFGQMTDLAPLQAAANARALHVLEDAAQAIGARSGGRPPGSGSKAATLSFFPSKNLGAMGDAGMVLTDDAPFAERLRLVRNHGQREKHTSQVQGGNFRIDEIQAAILRAKLPYLDGWTAARRRVAALYRSLLADARIDPELLALPHEAEGSLHTYHQLVVRTPRRDALRDNLAQHNIGAAVYYPNPLHLQPCFAHLGYSRGDFPASERASRECLALPVYAELPEEAVRTVVKHVQAFFTRSSR
jgi:dTDP-4-amino-4,6-dideoxygalactose transaminase